VLQIDGVYHCYYTGHKEDATPPGAVFCRTSPDLHTWSDPVIVGAGGAATAQAGWPGCDSECPFVVDLGGHYCLFRNQRYGLDSINTQYVSPDPLDFGVNDDRYRVGTLPVAAPEIIVHEGGCYIAALLPSLKGIRIARLEWVAA
jgi:hypothetical protein